MTQSRREFLQTAALTNAALGAFAQQSVARTALPPAPPAIDTHTHFYDPTRKAGVPWPPPSEPILYKPHYPCEFQTLTAPQHVVGTVIVEASPWVEDNQWILELAKDNPFIVGFIGNLKLGEPGFAAQLQRFAANPLWRGLRIGEKPLAEGLGQKAFESDLQRLGERALTLDVVGGAGLLPNVVRVTKLAPKLRVVIDHLPFAARDNAPAAMRQALIEVAALPQVFAKVSNVVRRVENRVVEDAAAYRPALDVLCELFGADRVIFGSNWPVSNRVAPYATLHKIVADYFGAQGPAAAEKYFWKNSRAAYSWVARGEARGLK
ncbi:MAG: amidohydrolase family protein [Acidobacteria bacterium]|nr:amidohydrolase family protein [Acidobacteriota bacterium]MBI3427577.1 amidohydrolase family protein [Acidobacteriota bacterium]